MDLDDWGTLLTVLLALNLFLTGAALALLAAHRKATEAYINHTHGTRTDKPPTVPPTTGTLRP